MKRLTLLFTTALLGACSDQSSGLLQEVVPIGTTSNNTPSFYLKSRASGTLSFNGDCSSDKQYVPSGVSQIQLRRLKQGVYSNCSVQLILNDGSSSEVLYLSTFEIDTALRTVIDIESTAFGEITTAQATISRDEWGYLTEATITPEDTDAISYFELLANSDGSLTGIAFPSNIQRTLNAQGQVLSETGPDSASRYQYDNSGRLSEETQLNPDTLAVISTTHYLRTEQPDGAYVEIIEQRDDNGQLMRSSKTISHPDYSERFTDQNGDGDFEDHYRTEIRSDSASLTRTRFHNGELTSREQCQRNHQRQVCTETEQGSLTPDSEIIIEYHDNGVTASWSHTSFDPDFLTETRTTYNSEGLEQTHRGNDNLFSSVVSFQYDDKKNRSSATKRIEGELSINETYTFHHEY